jgi:hypothetical protein
MHGVSGLYKDEYCEKYMYGFMLFFSKTNNIFVLTREIFMKNERIYTLVFQENA